ncbi:arrestin domain-containing protein 17 [Haematobia irritans]|uniref:arrestin domain-containing protein 17 n=1 Tax=Haematobia irritans TaxID=7368 RepID=UPI003F4FDAC4
MSLVSCTLKFENARSSYQPGDVIKGLVIFNVHGSSTILIKALSIKFSGYATSKWEKPQTPKKAAKQKVQVFYVGREDYISTKNFLIGSEQANPSALQPGVYNYNFMVQLPQNAPSSFEGALGFIRYELQVHADYIDHLECLTSSLINVEQLKDLRRWSGTMQTLTENQKYEHKSCLKFWRHPLQLYVSIPQSGFVEGECISIHIKVSNHGHVKLKDITSKLNRIVTYKGSLKEGKKPKETHEMTTIACHIHSLFGQNGNVTQYLAQLIVPKTAPSFDFSECKCLSVSYELEVAVCAQNLNRSVKAVLPIVVGTISLTSDVKVQEESIAGNHAPAITVARSMDELNLPSSWEMREVNVSFQQTAQLSASMSSLASSYREADFMPSVKLNKKSKCQLDGDPVDFKPKYLYYDLPEETQTSFQDIPSTTREAELNGSQVITKTTDDIF